MVWQEYIAATNSLLKISGIPSCDCFGISLQIDSAYRDLNQAKTLLAATQVSQLQAPHTDAADLAIKEICNAQRYLRDFAVSPDDDICTSSYSR